MLEIWNVQLLRNNIFESTDAREFFFPYRRHIVYSTESDVFEKNTFPSGQHYENIQLKLNNVGVKQDR